MNFSSWAALVFSLTDFLGHLLYIVFQELHINIRKIIILQVLFSQVEALNSVYLFVDKKSAWCLEWGFCLPPSVANELTGGDATIL